MIAKYDVVHIRLVATIIKNNDPTVLVKNLAKLLSMSNIAFSINDVRQMWTNTRPRRRLTNTCIEPGGFLQWDELDTPTAHVTVTAPNLETDALEQLRELLISPMKGRNGEYGPVNNKILRLRRASIDH